MESLRKVFHKALKYIFKNGELLALILILIVASFAYERFMTYGNITNVLRQVSMSALIGVGMTLVILTGGIDLSVGSITAFCGILAAYLSGNIYLAVAVPLLVGFLLGLLNGYIVSRLSIVPFIATLATQMAIRGAGYLMTGLNSVPVGDSAAAFLFLGRASIAGIPFPTIVMVLGFATMSVVTRRTGFGRSIYAIGGNEDAARMIGLKVDRNKALSYAINGLFCAIAGILLTSRLGAGQPSAAKGWEMDVVAYVAIGGTLLTGGVGGVEKTLIGVLIIGFIGNIINQQGNLSSYWQNILTGMIIMSAIAVQSILGKRQAGQKTAAGR